MVYPFSTDEGHTLRDTTLLLAGGHPEATVWQQDRCVEHRYPDLLTALRTSAFWDKNGRRFSESSRWVNLLFEERAYKQRSQGLHFEVSHQEPKRPPPDDQISGPLIHTYSQQLIFQHLPTLLPFHSYLPDSLYKVKIKSHEHILDHLRHLIPRQSAISIGV